MKILHIITSLESGGAERMLSKLVNEDSENTHIIVTLLKSKSHYVIEDGKIINFQLDNNIINKIKLVFMLRSVVKSENPNIIQTWMKSNYYGPFIKILIPKKKIVSNFRNGYSRKHNKLTTKALNILHKFFDGHIFVSNSAFEERVNKNLKFSHYIIIPNGFDIPNLNNKSIDNRKFTIGHIGRYHPVKNQVNIVKAFSNFSHDKNVQMIMAGKNLNSKNLKIKESINEKIIYLGEIHDIDSFYKEINVLVLASISEGFPNVIGEAMSRGISVIATDAGESFEILGNTGYKLQSGSVSDIQEAFNYMYEKKDINHANKAMIRKKIQENYSLDFVIKKYQDFYKKIGERQ